MKHKMIIFCTALLVTALTPAAANAQVQAEHYTTKLFDCAIFPADYPTGFNGKHYTPTHSEVDKAESALKDSLKNVDCHNKSDMREILRNLKKYKLQVFAYTGLHGDTLLFINCFRNDKNKDKDIAASWLNTLIKVQNGGDYFWTIQYDVSTNQLFSFKENGSWN